MSRHRLIAKIRTNPDYSGLARYLDALGLRHRVNFPNGRVTGHPALLITTPTGVEIAFTISSTPHGRCNVPDRIAKLRRFLIKHGIEAPPGL